MTTRINLLPWREWRRKKAQREFIGQLVLVVALGIVVWGAWHYTVSSNVDAQRRRNALIEERISKLDDQIAQIKELEERRQELVERMKVIQELQGNRPTIVYLFDQLVRTLPDGVYYTSITRTGKDFKIVGVSESNNRISRLMRNLEQSRWFKAPNLQSVSANEDEQGQGQSDQGDNEEQSNRFILTVTQANPRNQDEDSGGQKGKKGGQA